MTEKQFYEALAALDVKWRLSFPALIRSEIYPYPDRPNDREYVCPITAVCWKVTGKVYDVGQTEKAAVTLDLPDLMRLKLLDCADSNQPVVAGGAKMREKLLKATGLEGEPTAEKPPAAGTDYPPKLPPQDVAERGKE